MRPVIKAVNGSREDSKGAAVEVRSQQKSDEKEKPAAEKADTAPAERAATPTPPQPESTVSAATTQIMNILSSYQARLGAATTSLSTGSVLAGTTKATQGGDEANAKGEDKSAAGTAPESTLVGMVEAIQTRQYPLSTLLLVAVLFFLLGSLVRSLQSPADFLLLPPALDHGDGTEAIAKELSRLLADVNSCASGIATREIKRLIELRGLLFGYYDFVIAITRRQ